MFIGHLFLSLFLCGKTCVCFIMWCLQKLLVHLLPDVLYTETNTMEINNKQKVPQKTSNYLKKKKRDFEHKINNKIYIASLSQ